MNLNLTFQTWHSTLRISQTVEDVREYLIFAVEAEFELIPLADSPRRPGRGRRPSRGRRPVCVKAEGEAKEGKPFLVEGEGESTLSDVLHYLVNL